MIKHFHIRINNVYQIKKKQKMQSYGSLEKYAFFSSLLANNTVEREWVTCRRGSNLRLSKDTSTFR